MSIRNRIKISYQIKREDIEQQYGKRLSEYHWSHLKRYIKHYYCDNERFQKTHLTEVITNSWEVDEPLRILTPKELKELMN